MSWYKMLQYQKTDVSEEIDVNKTSELCYYLFFKDVGVKFEKHVFNGYHDLLTMAYSLKNIAVLSVKGTTFRCLLMGSSKNEAVKKINNSVIYDRVLQI